MLFALFLLSSLAFATTFAQQIHVYTRPKGQGTVQHLHMASTLTPCFNLQSRHIGSIETNDAWVQLSFYRSKDCLGAPILRSMQPNCPHPNTLRIRTRSVRIKRLDPIHSLD